MTGAAYNALRRIGARSPLRAGYRGSFALLGYTGPGKPAFIRQVMENTYLLYLAPCGAYFFQWFWTRGLLGQGKWVLV